MAGKMQPSFALSLYKGGVIFVTVRSGFQLSEKLFNILCVKILHKKLSVL